ncbi:M24 family metallopeptidase [Bradyrhizobium diazoefficiens]|uniref:M24 family metallopeptidase n=1 Tax=Bradyrhizobium diazoefficiens TaxID=1355477 RepID=UPI0032E4C964
MTTSEPIPFTGIPFPKWEYQLRHEKVFKAMERFEIDALLVTAFHHQRYLTGYNGYGGYFRPFPVVFVPGRSPVYVIREYELTGVRAYSCIDTFVTYTHLPDWPKAIGGVLKSYGVHDKRVGLQLGCWNLAPKDVTELQAELPNMKLVDATHLIPQLAAVKTDLELKVMREAMAMTDIAVRTFQNSLRAGLSEEELSDTMTREVAKVGGELWTTSTNIAFGERTKIPHGVATSHQIKNNEPAMIEVGGAKHGYAAGIVRSAVLGRHPEAEFVHALAVDALEEAFGAIKAGVTAASVDAAARKVVRKSALPRAFRHRTGYHTGIHWGGRANLSLEPESKDILEAGMTFHMPVILFGESDIMIGCSEHVLVTDKGAELLSSTPHTLHSA